MGTRIQAIAGSTPKSLLPVEGRPFLSHLMDFLAASGVEKTVLCLGVGASQISDTLQTHDTGDMQVVQSLEEHPLGTGGAIHNALAHLGETFFILNGDTFLDASLAPLLNLHREKNAVLTLSLIRFEDAGEKGSVRSAPDGRVLAFDEKTGEGTGLINGGVYVADSSIFAGCSPGVTCSLEREVIPGLLEAGEPVFGQVVDAEFVDIGLPEDYLRVRDHLPRKGGWQ
jgi:NDP-sugar pyrophosphorylase family protein